MSTDRNGRRREGGGGGGGGGRASNDFRYPPRNGGLYFGNNFVLGGEEFGTMSPESFLFGDLSDLNSLARVPGSMPEAPPNIKHTVTVRSLVALQKDSIRLVRHARQGIPVDEHHLEFTFDADCKCEVTVYFFAEEVASVDGSVVYEPWPVRATVPGIAGEEDSGPAAVAAATASSGPVLSARCPPRVFEAGIGQVYSFPMHGVRGLSRTPRGALTTNNDGDRCFVPLVIFIDAINPPTLAGSVHTPQPHSHTTFANLDLGNEGAVSVKPLVQKIQVQGLTYVLKEIYGLEKQGRAFDEAAATTEGGAKKPEEEGGEPEAEEEEEEDSTECVICMSSPRDTMVLPCRHLCLCNPCAEVLRHQADKCPICRAPFHSLLQLRVACRIEEVDPDELEFLEGQEDAPPGYALVPVGMAINGPAVQPSSGPGDEEETTTTIASNTTTISTTASMAAAATTIVMPTASPNSAYSEGDAAGGGGYSSGEEQDRGEYLKIASMEGQEGYEEEEGERGGGEEQVAASSISLLRGGGVSDGSGRGSGIVQGHKVSLPGTATIVEHNEEDMERSLNELQQIVVTEGRLQHQHTKQKKSPEK